jgi:TRAP-type C4-dicarboxylate transport system substrate-binding protein
MKNNFKIAGTAVASLILILAFFGWPVQAAEKFSWTMISPFPHSDLTAQRMMEFTKDVEKETKGQFKIKLLVAGQHPYQYRDGLKIATDGLAQISHTGLTYLTSVESWFSLPLVPYAVPLDKHMEFLIRWHEDIVNPYLEKKYKLKVLSYFLDAGGWGNAIHTPVPLLNFESLKGLKIRAHDKNTAFLARVFGAVPATVPYSELYVALQRKAIDGVMTSLQGAYAQKLWELVKYTCMYEPYFGVDEIVVKVDTWKRVPLDLQKKVQALFDRWLSPQPMYDFHSKKNEEIVREAKEKYGATFNTLSEDIKKQAKEKCQPLYEGYVSGGGEMAKKSMNFLDALIAKK